MNESINFLCTPQRFFNSTREKKEGAELNGLSPSAGLQRRSGHG
jgi:hypothetical protein